MNKVDASNSVLIDNVEVAIDRVAKGLSTGLLGEIVVEVPVVKNIAALVRIAGSIRDYYTVRKMHVFLETLKHGDIDRGAYKKLAQKCGEDKLMTEVLKQIDRFYAESHAEIYAYLYQALLKGEVTWESFGSLGFALEKIDPVHFRVDFEIDTSSSNYKANSLPLEFEAAGLAFKQITLDGGSLYYLTLLGKQFYLHGLAPYQRQP